MDGLFWKHMWQYETSMLRKVFFAEVTVRAPGWVQVFT
jgi:hypothetical protein